MEHERRSTKGIEDIVRRNVAALRSKANLTQQGLADEMLLRGIAWTRETVAQVETTNRRLGLHRGHRGGRLPRRPHGPAHRHRRRPPSPWVRASGRRPTWEPPSPEPAGDIFPPESYASPALGTNGAASRGAPSRRPGRPHPRTCRNDAAPRSIDGSPGTATNREQQGRRATDSPVPTGPTEGGRAHRTPTEAAGDGQRRRRHRTTALVAEPRRRTGAPGHRPACPDRWIAEDDPRSCLTGSRSRDRLRDGTESGTGRAGVGATRGDERRTRPRGKPPGSTSSWPTRATATVT